MCACEDDNTWTGYLFFFDTIECWCFQWSETYLFIHRSLVLQMTIWFIKCIVSFSSHARCCHLLGMEEHSALQQLNISSFCSVFINTDFFVFCVNLYSVKLKSLKNLNCCLKFHLLSEILFNVNFYCCHTSYQNFCSVSSKLLYSSIITCTNV